MEITVTLTIDQLMKLPGDAIIHLLDTARPSREFLEKCREHENRPDHGKGRWPVNNYLRMTLAAAV